MDSRLEGYDWDCAFHETQFGSYGSISEQEFDSEMIAPGIEPAPPGADVSRSPFKREDVSEIIGIVYGERDGDSWEVAGRLNDGRWFYISASCDYTGWDCRAWGQCVVAANKEDIMQFGISPEEAERMGIK